MLDELLQAAIIINILAATIRISTPLLLGAMGELVAEHSGVMNMGLEGMMMFGVFTVWLVTFLGGNTTMGILTAMLVGALLGLLLAFLVIYLKVDQTVAGLSINILAIGFNEFYVRMANASNIPVQIELLPNMNIPLLSGVPIIGEIFFQQRFLTYLAFILVPVIAWFLGRTKFGLSIAVRGKTRARLTRAASASTGLD